MASLIGTMRFNNRGILSIASQALKSEYLHPSMRSNAGVLVDPPLEFSAWQGRSKGMSQAHAHTDIELNFVLEGEMNYFLSGRFETILSGQVGVFWAGSPHITSPTRTQSEAIWVVIPLSWLLAWNISKPFTHALLQGEMVTREISGLDIQNAMRWCTDLKHSPNGASAEFSKIAALEVEAFMRRTAMDWSLRQASTLQKSTPPSSPALSEKTQAMAAFASDNYQDDIMTSQIAAAVDLHPNYAMQLFKEEFGLSLWSYVLRLRVCHAQYLMLTTGDTMTAIAHQSGFHSTSRFYAAFKQNTKKAPGEWKRAQQRGAQK